MSFPLRAPALPIALALLLLAGTAPSVLQAQSGPYLLSLVPTDGRALTLEVPASGRLVPGHDYAEPYGRLMQGWRFQGTPGQDVTFDLMSDDFDAYLYLLGEGHGELLENDDSGGACHARIRYRIGSSGEVLLVASGYVEVEGAGEFALHARLNPPPPVDESCGGFGDWSEGPTLPEDLSAEGRRLEVGSEVTGWLSADGPFFSGQGAPLQAWALELTAGQRVIIDLMSDDFDAYLYVTGPGMDSPELDDDGGDGLNSQLVFTAPASGTFLVAASAFFSGEGSYTLRAMPAGN